MQSHTPFTELVASLRDKTILVTGQDSNKCRTIAEAYGFRKVITPSDILAAEPRVWPFKVLEDVYASSSRPLPDTALDDSRPASARDSLVKVDAMFVFNDPRDWAVDIQIITDLLLSEKGYLGTYSSKNGDESLDNCGWQGDGQPSLYFSNGDLFWSTGYHSRGSVRVPSRLPLLEFGGELLGVMNCSERCLASHLGKRMLLPSGCCRNIDMSC